MELQSFGLCISLCGDSAGYAGQRLYTLWPLFHAVFGYVSSILSVFQSLPADAAVGKKPPLQLECGIGHGLSGAGCLLPGIPSESAQCSGSGEIAAGLFLPPRSHQAGTCQPVLFHLPEWDFQEKRLFHHHLRLLLRPLRLGVGLSVERHVAGYLCAPAPGGAGHCFPAAG